MWLKIDTYPGYLVWLSLISAHSKCPITPGLFSQVWIFTSSKESSSDSVNLSGSKPLKTRLSKSKIQYLGLRNLTSSQCFCYLIIEINSQEKQSFTYKVYVNSSIKQYLQIFFFFEVIY